MEKERLRYLLEQYLAEIATAPELEELSQVLKAGTDSTLARDLLAEMMAKETPAFPADKERWLQLPQEIVQIDKHRAERPATSPAPVFKLFWWTAAAAVLLLIGLGGYLWMNQQDRSSLAITETNNRDSVVSTAPGEQRAVVLPDGSHVWLNAASSLRFPVAFTGSERVVELSGEAFFDVAHADRIPFRIHSGKMTTTVLGTAFNITAHPPQNNMAVAVQRGKVQVQTGDRVLAVLEKGRQIKVSPDTFYLKDVDTLSVAAWRTGRLLYKDELLEDIVADLQRTFKDSIVIQSPALKKTSLTISFDQQNGLEQALYMLCRATDSRLNKKDGIYTIE
ncbi:DUF4974 domain-containing protein [Pseudoflavitalea sp. X16]|uniref:FecR family protein n=1 Tax=Paraflavitalea devenefica TaxID=2716334 RepID=UPI001421CFAC|nr:FecR domain-containing protein [Paraflavitalea devenefica]NII26086.1 DUF4974 domain-containing protein [Paraflavitalea devenefica]